jgi:hypothetical protein
MAQLPCVTAARPLLAVPPARGRRPNAARRRLAATGVRAAAAAEAGVDDEEEEEEEEEVVVERYALGGACKVLAGMPAPLGATALAGGVNFAIYSGGASAAALCLFTPDDLNAVGELLVAAEQNSAVSVLFRTVPYLSPRCLTEFCVNGAESSHGGGSASSQTQPDGERVACVYRGGTTAHHALRVQV